jgi:hypothetical protein
MGKRRTFVVEGEGIFPLDMLRYDKCWPATADDVAEIAAACSFHGDGLRRISLVSDDYPTLARWESFNWTVLGAIRGERLVLSKKG